MKLPLRILHLEDDPTDALLVQSILESEGVECSITCVRDRAGYLAAIERGGFNLIFSDYTLPGFNGIAALEIARKRYENIPFILISGTMGEEQAIESLKGGATDYVLKNRLSRLVPAVQRAIREVEERIERQKLEEHFIEAQKMEVVGQLAGGVAHDFNNILGVIIGYSDLMMRSLDPNGPLHKQAEEIRHAAERASGVTRQLLVFSRKHVLQPVVLDINAVVESIDKMLKRLINENVELVLIPGKQLGHIRADAGQLGQILMNLVINARDAMPNGGRITIETAGITVDEAYRLKYRDVLPGDYVLLTVSDTGQGMSDEIKARLFEPFFTTKPEGRGTGLGLATCQTIVKQSCGYIHVESEAGKGTTFRVMFPRVEQPVAVPPSQPVKAEALPSGSETVLVVEDELSVRRLACTVLETQGYQVLQATNGQEGLQILRDHKGSPIRIVVTDIVMPQMDGKVMASWLKSMYPDVRILFTSGYSDRATAQDALDPWVPFLPKPYTPGALLRRVRDLLDAN